MINGMHYVEGANPHPPSSLSAGGTCRDNVNNLTQLYFNARSLVPKYSELCAVVEAYNPDIVCIVESYGLVTAYLIRRLLFLVTGHIDWTEIGMGVVSLSMFVKLLYQT